MTVCGRTTLFVKIYCYLLLLWVVVHLTGVKVNNLNCALLHSGGQINSPCYSLAIPFDVKFTCIVINTVSIKGFSAIVALSFR